MLDKFKSRNTTNPSNLQSGNSRYNNKYGNQINHQISRDSHHFDNPRDNLTHLSKNRHDFNFFRPPPQALELSFKLIGLIYSNSP